MQITILGYNMLRCGAEKTIILSPPVANIFCRMRRRIMKYSLCALLSMNISKFLRNFSNYLTYLQIDNPDAKNHHHTSKKSYPS